MWTWSALVVLAAVCVTFGAPAPKPECLGTRSCLDSLAKTALTRLSQLKLNLITAESLTCGYIASTLVDVPGFGEYVYGGHSVYDVDAKRQFLGVTVPNVYSEHCAREMAYGAVKKSRALVGLAVTGSAGPVPFSKVDALGVVYIAVSLRTTCGSASPDPYSKCFETATRTVNLCEEKDGNANISSLCGQYKSFAKNGGQVPESIVSELREDIREATVAWALSLLTSHLSASCAATSCPRSFESLPSAYYDGAYLGCGEPSAVINRHLDRSVAGVNTNSTGSCPDTMSKYPAPPHPETVAIRTLLLVGLLSGLLGVVVSCLIVNVTRKRATQEGVSKSSNNLMLRRLSDGYVTM